MTYHCYKFVMLSQPQRRSIWGGAFTLPPQIPPCGRNDITHFQLDAVLAGPPELNRRRV